MKVCTIQKCENKYRSNGLCNKHYARKRYQDNKDYFKKYRQDNKERIGRVRALWKKQNPEKVQAYRKIWEQRNPKKHRANIQKQNKRRGADAKILRELRKSHPELFPNS